MKNGGAFFYTKLGTLHEPRSNFRHLRQKPPSTRLESSALLVRMNSFWNKLEIDFVLYASDDCDYKSRFLKRSINLKATTSKPSLKITLFIRAGPHCFLFACCRYIEYLSSLQPIAYEPAVVDNAGGSASGHANGAVSNGGTGGDGDGKEGPAHAVPSPLSSSSHLSPSSLEELESQLKAAAVAKGEDARLSKRQRIAAAAARAKHRGWAIPVDDL